jgi:hypothetical protein
MYQSASSREENAGPSLSQEPLRLEAVFVSGKETLKMQNYCDIMPHATGWVYVIDGVQCASFYHTYELALEAARSQLASQGGYHTRIFRYQGLNGSMMPIQPLKPVPPVDTRPISYP